MYVSVTLRTSIVFWNGSATRYLRNGEKYYICFVGNLLLFPTVKELLNSVDS